MLDNIYMYISLASVTYIIYSLIMKPLNLQYKRVLSQMLGKEIDRSLYKKMHSEFIFDDCQSQIILSATMEEFTRLLNQEGIIQRESYA